AFCQGVILGGLVQGITVTHGQYGGGAFDWFTPFGLMCGVGVVTGYALLGATWLNMKTDGATQARAREQATPLLFGVLFFMAIVSLWTPLAIDRIAARWFSTPNIYFLWPVPVLTALVACMTWRALR